MLNTSNYVTNSTVNFKVFTEQQCQELHSAALEILERVGVDIHSEKALEVAKKAGAYVEGNRNMKLEGNRFYFTRSNHYLYH